MPAAVRGAQIPGISNSQGISFLASKPWIRLQGPKRMLS